MEKIKKKYKDQDEEERELRMKLLGIKKPTVTVEPVFTERPERPKKEVQEKNENEEPEEDEEIQEDENQNDEDAKIVNELCSKPIEDDSLLYVVPVCAPYFAMQKYKYKVKITPGNGKRGKAAKMALQLFLVSYLFKFVTDFSNF